MHPLTIIAYSSEVIAAILASIYFYKYNHTNLKYFLVYLWYNAANELGGLYLLNQGFKFELTNLFYVIAVTYYLSVIRMEVASRNLKLTASILIIAFLLIVVSDLSLNGLSEAWKMSNTLGSTIAIIGFLLYLIHTLKSSNLTNWSRNMINYFVAGFALFFIAGPVINLARVLYINNYALNVSLSYIMAIVAILMYTIFSFGFIYSKKASELEEN
ncbi:hypothetical protein ACFO5T_11680 [Dokdonia genika]|jgi:F0F1-type ATP synthase assembly protein I|uniref:Uncharacterized protein n=1 Tax=Dokdonia genika TaxID=308113 RepID=A0ABV9LBM2_9FLAO|nr:hypothetical protein [Dokdonia sp. MED134]EAQ39049.1 hypothetical protein MED134_00480 [Dokdonia sp. MED134]